MAPRTLNRRALRDQNDEVQADGDEREDDGDDDTPAPKAKKKPRAAKTSTEKKPAKPRAPRKKVVKDERMVARWAVCNNGMKRVAVFEYRDRAAADAKLIQLREGNTATFFLILVKDPFEVPDAIPCEGK